MERAVNRPLLCADLIGRGSELAEVRGLLQEVRAGYSRVLVISGEAGVGKSRLIRECKVLATGFQVAQGTCFPTDAASPYALVLDVLRSLFGVSPESELLAALGPLAPLLYALLPDLLPAPAEPIPLPAVESQQAKRRLEALLAQFLLGRAEKAPLLLIVEDLHWSDASSLDFLFYLARRATAVPLLLATTYRTEEANPPLGEWLSGLERERLITEVRIDPLSRQEVDSMLAAIFDEPHTSPDRRRLLHGELLEALFLLTEGNPFFIEETLSALLVAGDIFPVGEHWNRREAGSLSIPRSVQDAVQRRSAGLGTAARQLLTLAAVAGRQFDFELLQRLTGYSESEVLRNMKELVAAQLVTETSDDQFAFRHALTRESIYSQLLNRERRSLHRAIAATMEQAPPEVVVMRLEDLAYHFYQARDWAKVFEYGCRAGEKAAGLYAHRAAIAYFTWALEACRVLSLPPPPAIYRGRGQAYEALGEFEHAEQDYSQAMQIAGGEDLSAEWQGAIDLGLLWAERDYHHSETWFRRALYLAETLDDPRLRARSLNRLGNWHLNVEQPHEALRAHQEALPLLQSIPDEQGIAETLDLLGMASYLAGDLRGGTALCREAIDRFRNLKDQVGLSSSLATLALGAATFQTDALVSAATLTEVGQDIREALEIARAIGQRPAEAYALFQLGLVLGSQGEYGPALEAARESLTIAEEINHRQWQSAAHTVLAGLYSGVLAYQEAQEHGAQALALARETGSRFWTLMATGYLAGVAVERHAPGEAARLLQPTLESLPDEVPVTRMSQRLLWCAAVELALDRGEAEKALQLADRLILPDAHDANEGRSLRVMKLRGEALLSLSRLEEAAVELVEALSLADAQGARPVRWRILLDLGKLYRQQGRATESEQALRDARVEIEKLAASVADPTLREHFMGHAVARLPSPALRVSPVRDRQAFGGLTSREREVAILIARGESNQAIADALVVTKRTVETHIGNILFKLGLRSRTQIAVWAVESGLASHSASSPPWRAG
jgi:DNA-binding NarL/FixJ family response regulator